MWQLDHISVSLGFRGTPTPQRSTDWCGPSHSNATSPLDLFLLLNLRNPPGLATLQVYELVERDDDPIDYGVSKSRVELRWAIELT